MNENVIISVRYEFIFGLHFMNLINIKENKGFPQILKGFSAGKENHEKRAKTRIEAYSKLFRGEEMVFSWKQKACIDR